MLILGICGASGSGKSTLAEHVKEALSCSCRIIGLDCYYHNFPELSYEERCKLNYDEPAIFNFDELYLDVQKLVRGELITTKGYDFVQYLRNDSPELISPPDVLILEGIHMFYDKRLCELMNLKVYLQVDADICLLRRIRRDLLSRGRTIESVSDQYLKTVKPMYEQYIAHYISDADFAIMRGGANEKARTAIVSYLNAELAAAKARSLSGASAE